MDKPFSVQTSVGSLWVPGGEVAAMFAENLAQLRADVLAEALWLLAEEIGERQDRAAYLAGVTSAMRANREQWDETAMDALEDALSKGDD